MLDHVLIIGGGEFGISTALALLARGRSKVTIVEAASSIPNPSGSSVDASRIIRSDYASKLYAALAIEAQVYWRDQSDSGWGGQGRYSETGFVLTANNDVTGYVQAALETVRGLAKAGLPIQLDKIEQLNDQAAIRHATGYHEVTGDSGYANWNSGWAHAEKVVDYAVKRLIAEGGDRVVMRLDSKVDQLLIDDGICKGAIVAGEQIMADLTIVAAGAWSPSLIDLQGRCVATGQALAFIDITPEEQKEMMNRPVIMNFSRGMFIIPPENCRLKVARHGFGHVNPEHVKHPDGSIKEVSVPRVGVSIPEEAEQACRSFLEEVLPHMADRPFTRTRLCWYCDTPDGDFLVDYYPHYQNLFIATGGSGHGFKFFPVLGEKVLDCIEGKLDPDLRELWSWRTQAAEAVFYCEDGSRAGSRGLKLD